MERDPLRLAWRAAPLLHAVAFALFLVALPLTWAGLDLIRAVFDDVVTGTADALSAQAVLLGLFGGMGLSRFGLAAAASLALALLLVAGICVAVALGRLRAGIAARGAAMLRRTALEALAASRPAAADEARDLATLLADGYARQTAFLGGALLAPAAAFGAITLALFYALTLDARLAAAVLTGAVLAALAESRSLRARARAERAGAEEAHLLRLAAADLARRLPALRAHGTASGERERLAALLRRRRAPVRAAESRAGRAAGIAAAARLSGPAAALGVGAFLGLNGEATAGAVAAAAAAALVAAGAVSVFARWQEGLDAVRPLFDALAAALAALPAQRNGAGVELPGAGRLAAEGVAAFDPASGARLAPFDLSVTFPAHLALIGDGDAGARLLAALIGGRIEPTSGRLSFGGVDLAGVAPETRARRIAYAGGETVLVAGSLRENLLYGCPDAASPDAARRLADAVATVGLDAFVQRCGLAGAIDPAREPDLARALVEARGALRRALDAERLADAIDPFTPDAYNRHATIGENILFGVPVGEPLREASLPSQPFLRAILEAEGLTKPLTAMGEAIAAQMVEIFADIPDDHPLFARFSFFSPGERSYFEHLVERPDEPRRGADAARDRDRLIGLALRYGESRHRLGLVDPELEARLLRARASFAELLPANLQAAIELYRPDRYLAAASLSDNLLFGRISHDRAGAEASVRAVVRRVLTERGLDGAVREVGLNGRLDPEDADLLPSEAAGIDLARCLVRRPDIVVAERALEGLAAPAAAELVQRLRRALIGRGLVLVAPALGERLDTPPFDVVARLESGRIASLIDRRVARPEAPGPTPPGKAVAASGTAA